ncbi:alpha-2-macroglobulin [Hahella sp. HN01]|uniref:alpha-2-macroglobulin family protein n=1 Tax=Hahella sp. HN01 TaxID=2847262 RepID=UPI001C1F093C|nr:alpha-2-macroglobulin [Hahella sp. HN01]MBU6953503.1 alpha-2-macroglobulin family protein [Hahella sp. HN01]
MREVLTRWAWGLLLVLMVGCSGESGNDEGGKTAQSQPAAAEKRPVIPAPQPEAKKPPVKVDRETLKKEYAQTPFKILRIGEQPWDDGPALSVTFSAPLDQDTMLGRYLTVADEQNQPVAGDWILNPVGTTAFFPFVEPEKRYKVTVSQGLSAITGRMLEEGTSQEITTRRLDPSVRFISRGAQLSPELTDGLEIEALNIDAVDMDIWRISDDKMTDFVGGYLGRSYYELEQLRSWGELVYGGRFDLNIDVNKRKRRLIDLSSVEPLKQPGIFVAIMKGAGHYPYEYVTTWFTVSDIGLQVRTYQNQMLAWVNGLADAKPRSGVSIELINQQGKMLRNAKTDSDGVATFEGAETSAVLAIARTDKQLALVRLNQPAMDLTEFKLPSRKQNPLELFLYSPRDLYRPGETVHINALLRDHDGRKVTAMPIQAELTRPDGRVHTSFTWQGDEQSFYTTTFSLPENTLTGDWFFKATLGNGDYFLYRLQVEDFLPERMRLEIKPDAENYSTTDTINLQLQAEYLWGAPASGNRAETTLQIAPARTVSETFSDFIFGEDNDALKETLSLPPVDLDEEGHYSLELPNHWSDATMPVRVRANVSVFESGGRPVARQWQQSLWPSESLVGVRPLWDGDIADPETSAAFELIHINQADELLGMEYLDATLVREDSAYYWRWSEDGWDYETTERNQPVYNRVLKIEPGQRLTMSVPVEYGNYRLELRDKQQNLLNAYKFFAGWTWDGERGGKGPRPEQVELRWDKNAYLGGDTAKLTLQAPFDGRAIVTVEANELLWRGAVDVKDGKAEINVPVKDVWTRHDMFATALVLRPGKQSAMEMPRRAWGMRHLPLDREARKMQIELKAPERVEPESKVAVQIQVQPGATPSNTVAVTLAAVDTGVLSLTRFKTPDPFAWFFSPRSYSAEIRDTYSSLIEMSSADRARQRFGGDADEMSRGGDAPVSDVQIVSLYSGKVALDAEGKGTIELQLPYFNGEVRLMAVAFDDARSGSAEKPMTIAAPVVAEVNLPRFLAFGDKTEALWDLQSLLPEQRKLSVKVSADNPLGSGEFATEITLAGKGREWVRLPLEAIDAEGVGKLSLSVTSTDGLEPAINIQREWKLGLRPPYPAQLNVQSHVLESGAAMSLTDPLIDMALSSSLETQLSVGPVPPLDSNEYMKYLIQYPYGCLEQTSSRVWPLLLATEQDLFKYDRSSGKQLAQERDQWVEKGLGRISGMQRYDGSFGLWGNDSDEYHWLSVYATDLLLTAKQRGYNVDQGLLDNALGRLRTYLTTQGRLSTENSYYSEARDHYHLAYRAYAALVLASVQQAKLADVRTLYDNYSKWAKSPLPLAQLALALEKLGDARRAQEAWYKALHWGEIGRYYAGDYGSPVRDLAWTLLLSLDSAVAKQPWDLIYPLRDELRDRRWLSTQEQMALYRLSLALNSKAGAEWKASLALNGESEVLEQTQQWINTWSKGSWPGDAQLSNMNDFPLFVTFKAQGYPTQAPKQTFDGIEVEREFFDLNGQPLNVKKLESGDFVLVMLQVRTQGHRYLPDALLVDLLPAGLELENQNLANATRFDEVVVRNKMVRDWVADTRVLHQEYRDDRYVAAVPLDAYSTSVIFYLARAVSPGEYVIPPTVVEDMYRPYYRAISNTPGKVTIKERSAQ